ncbi:hypothetical protein ABR737_43440 [Streptomyces sp. Edi2]|uniref:hypothetical protein n=1 Tax=Streptomyces sp. Edi2 TaxID=3162528 RepID=UPI0033065F8B
MTKDNDPLRFLSWCPEVTEHLLRLDDNGTVVDRRFTVLVEGFETTFSADDLKSGRVWREMVPGARGYGRAKVRDALENVVTQQASGLAPTWMLNRTGWFDLPDGRWLYVRASDKATKDVPVRTVDIKADVVKASRPLAKPAGFPAQKRAMRELAARGWGPPLGLAVGVRALAWSIVPVYGSLIPVGKNNTGKTLTLWVATCLTLTAGWPPVVDASFNDTITAIEKKIGQAQDRAIGLEDMPLTANSEAAEVREAVQKADRVTRAAFNNQPIRDRSDRKGQLVGDSVHVKGILILTAQQLPMGVQASMLRRVVTAEYVQGDNDWAWYEKHGYELEPAFRTIGDKVIAHLSKLGKEKAEAWVKECDRKAAERFLPIARAAIGEDAPDGMGGVLKVAYQMLAGFNMVADACGLNVEPLWQTLIPKLTASLKTQADAMGNRQVADTGISEALGAVLRKGLQERRVHIRCTKENLPKALVPGQTPQAQGLREDMFQGQSNGFGGEGAALYFLEDIGALGITASDLHTLISNARDVRLTGHQVKSLPSFLLKEGAVLRSTQKGQNATTKHRIGTGRGAPLLPLVLIPASTVFTLPESEEPNDGQEQQEQGPEPTPDGVVHQLVQHDAAPVQQTVFPEQRAAQQDAALAQVSAQDTEAAQPEMQQEVVAAPSEPASVQPVPSVQPVRPVLHGAAPMQQGRVPGQPSPMGETPRPAGRVGDARGVVLAVEGGQLANAADARAVELTGDATTDLAALVAQASALVPSGTLTLLIGQDAHRGYRLAAEAPALGATPWAKPFQALVDEGWHRPYNPQDRPYVGRSVLLEHPERKGLVRITPVKWLGLDGFPRVRTQEMRSAEEEDRSDALTLAYRLDRFAEITGYAFEGTFAGTGITMLRSMVEATAQRYPKWQGNVANWPDAVDDSDWSRQPTDAEKAMEYTHLYDGNKAYLPGYRQAIVARDDLKYVKAPLFDEKFAGLWTIRVPDWPHPLLPAPVPNQTPGTLATVSTAIVMLYVEVGITPDIEEARIAERVEFQGLRQFSDSIRDQLKALSGASDPDDQAVSVALKEIFHAVHGKLRNDKQGVIRRPDWGHAIRDAAWTNMLRKAYVAAGVIKRKTGGPVEPQFPMRVKTDELAYASDNPDPLTAVPFGLRLGTGLGEFKAATQTRAAWEQEQAAKREKAQMLKARREARKARREGDL